MKIKSKSIFYDFTAAVSVVVILIPQGLAYGLLAGLSPIYGLYAALVPTVVYLLFSDSKEITVGPVALMSIMVIAGVANFAEPGTEEYLDLVLLTSFLSGLVQITFSFFRLGALSNFIAKPVMSGFIAAAGIIIVVSQLKNVFGIEEEGVNTTIGSIRNVYNNASSINVASVILALGSIVLIAVLQRIHKRVPAALIVTVLGILSYRFLNLEQYGIDHVGKIPQGLPSFYMGFLQSESYFQLLPTAFIISIVCFIGSHSIGRTLADLRNGYSIDPNKELLGLGMSKLVGSFFMAMPTTASFSRSAANERAGVQTKWSGLMLTLIVAIILVWMNGLFNNLSIPVLAAVVITSVFSLFDFGEAKTLFRISRIDFLIYIATFVLTLLLGIVNGILIGIAVSMIALVVKASNPHYVVLGKLPDSNEYRSKRRFPEALVEDHILIIRYDEDLFFGNSNHFFTIMKEQLDQKSQVQFLIIKAASFNKLDYTAIKLLEKLIDYCSAKGIRLVFTDLNGPIRDLFHKSGIYKRLGEDRFYLSVNDAVTAIHEHKLT